MLYNLLSQVHLFKRQHTYTCLDIVAICETWLGISDHDDTCVNGLLPDGYAIHRADRTDGRRGGGVALIYKQCLDIKCNKTDKYAQFEYLLCSIVVNNSSISIVVVYRGHYHHKKTSLTPTHFLVNRIIFFLISLQLLMKLL